MLQYEARSCKGWYLKSVRGYESGLARSGQGNDSLIGILGEIPWDTLTATH